ncbi:DUF2461 domain-containing protein [Ahrensia sp. R2A130]|uniref:DUF2461 domain-containing protein n=1 Tax=Ahrensia sp. R2A130 TaxID=744979 RepID=UPI0001E09BEC|nr:TIGR02453 family protein [Ahrensia sp. R2A130]EFL90010.1 conserved hypothetical protein [Ahrensia sp. R2A130]
MPEADFPGFPEDTLPFLKALGFHQSREWFHENKPLYEQAVKNPLAHFVDAASVAFAEADVPLKGSPRASTFRINRDIRFSKNKDPYNQHISGVLTRTGTKKDTGGVYFHFTTGGCLFASGLWMPSGPMLKAFRERLVEKPDEFFAIEADLAAKGLVWGEDNKLVRVPNSFKHVEDERLQDRLKMKSFIVERSLKDGSIKKPAIIGDLVSFAHDIMPMMQHVWRVTDHVREAESTT